MTRRYPNSVGQQGSYTSSKVHVPSTGQSLVGRRTFAQEAALGSWQDGDVVYVRIEKSTVNYRIWKAEWEPATESLRLVQLEGGSGTIYDGDTVYIRPILSGQAIVEAVTQLEPQSGGIITVRSLKPVSGVFTETASTSITLDDTYDGSVICLTASSAVVIALHTSQQKFHAVIETESASQVTLNAPSGGTINGVAQVSTSDKWVGIYIYQRAPGLWVANK